MRYLLLIYLTTVAVALLVIFGAFAANGATIPVSPGRIDAVANATHLYGWPHARTLAESVGIPLALRRDVNNANVGAGKQKRYTVAPVSCRWRNQRAVSPARCSLSVYDKRTRSTFKGDVSLRIYEDGSYTLTFL